MGQADSPSSHNPQPPSTLPSYGHYNYSAHPFAPPGMRIFIHNLPSQRRSWDPHATEGYYLGPSLRHYRCYRVWNIPSQAERIAQTVKWMPHNTITIPMPTPDKTLRASIQDLISTIQTIRPQQLPHLNASSIQLLRHLQTIFHPDQTNTINLPRVMSHHPSIPATHPQPRVMQHHPHSPSVYH